MTTYNNHDLIKGMSLGFLASIIFGGTLPVTKLGLQAFDPAFLTAARCALAGIFAGLYLLILRKPMLKRQHLPYVLAVAICLVGLFPNLIALGLKTVDASHAGVVVGAFPICSAVMAVFINHEKPSPFFWLFSLLGGALVVIFALRNGSAGLATGDIYMFVAVMCASAGYAFMGRLTKEMQGPDIISWAVFIAFPITALFTYVLAPSASTFASAKPIHYTALLYLALLSQWFGFFMLNRGFQLVSVSKVSQTQLFQVFSALIISSILLGEKLEWQSFGFAFAVMACVYAAGKCRHA